MAQSCVDPVNATLIRQKQHLYARPVHSRPGIHEWLAHQIDSEEFARNVSGLIRTALTADQKSACAGMLSGFTPLPEGANDSMGARSAKSRRKLVGPFSGSYRYRTIPRTLTLRASGPTMSGTPDRIPRVAPPRQPLSETRQGETTTTLAARCRTDEEPTTCTDVSNTQKRLNRWSNSSSRRPPAKSSTARWKSCVPASPPTQC